MKHKKIKKLLPLFFSVMICTFPVSAANENIALLDELQTVQTEEEGSIEIELTDGGVGTTKEDVVFEYAKVADVVDGEYELLEAYQGSGIDLNAIETAEQLEEAALELSAYKTSDGSCTTDEDGKAIIKDLDVGVYLLYASEHKRYDDITPLLIAIPTWGEQEGDMLYDVKVIPKHTPVSPGKIITDTPDSERDHVKTGDNVNIALCMAGVIVGATLIGTMLAFFYQKRKKNYEEK